MNRILDKEEFGQVLNVATIVVDKFFPKLEGKDKEDFILDIAVNVARLIEDRRDAR